jgi:hypothetical protein
MTVQSLPEAQQYSYRLLYHHQVKKEGESLTWSSPIAIKYENSTVAVLTAIHDQCLIVMPIIISNNEVISTELSRISAEGLTTVDAVTLEKKLLDAFIADKDMLKSGDKTRSKILEILCE